MSAVWRAWTQAVLRSVRICRRVRARRPRVVATDEDLPSTGDAQPEAIWSALITANRAYYESVLATGGVDESQVPFPDEYPVRRVPLTGSQLRIGRRSVSREVTPEIDLTNPPADPAISRLHAVLVAQPDGSWAVIDTGSENGTSVNGIRDRRRRSGAPAAGRRDLRGRVDGHHHRGGKMSSTEQVRAPRRTAPALAGRLAGVVVAAGFIAIGVVLATRPVGDEAMRAHATASADGIVQSAQSLWAGQYLVTVSWTDGSRLFDTRFVLPQASPPWSQSGDIGLLFDPSHPTTVALADPGWSLNSGFRTSAAFESVVPFSFSALALALLVVWPTRQSVAFTSDLIRRARRMSRPYVVVPMLICTLAVVPLVVIQAQPLLAYSPAIDNLTGPLSVLVVVGLIWPCVRAVRIARFRRLLTVVQDATDGAAVVNCVAGRKLWISGKSAGASNDQKADGKGIRLLLLRGQNRGQFVVGDRVRLYRRSPESGPTVVTDGASKVLVGVGRQAQMRIADPLAGRYPRLYRKLRRYRTSAQTVPVMVGAASVAVVIRFALNPAWLWLPVVFDGFWLTANLVRYFTLSPILRGPYDGQPRRRTRRPEDQGTATPWVSQSSSLTCPTSQKRAFAWSAIDRFRG